MLRADDALSTALSAHFDAIEAEDRALREWNRVEAETVKAGAIFANLQNERARGAALDLWRVNDPQAQRAYGILVVAKRLRRDAEATVDSARVLLSAYKRMAEYIARTGPHGTER